MSYRTENDATNKKVVTASLGGGMGAAIGTILQYVLVSGLERILNVEIPPQVNEAIFYMGMVGGSIAGAWLSGYYTAPVQGDGIVKE